MNRIAIALVSSLLVGLVPLASASASGPELERVYAEGHAYSMLGATLLTQASPGLLSAPPMYVIGYAVPNSQTSPITLPSGYMPQCNPCNHSPFPYHDHVLTGVPGLGINGTAKGDYEAPWRIVVMLYDPSYSNSPSFVPITSDDQIAAAEAAHELLPINTGAGNPYQIWTTQVLICPLVSPSA
jgi:hypothetical protein